MVSILEYVGKNDKQLEFEESYDTITAYLMENGEREYVGEISFAVQIIGDERTEEKRIACPKIANVLERYQKCGIATQIIKFAKKIYDDVYFAPDTGSAGNSNDIHYSDEGLAFKPSCERNNDTKDVLENDDEDYNLD